MTSLRELSFLRLILKPLLKEGISDIIGDDLKATETESEFELNFAVVKLRHKVVRKKA